MSYSSAHTPCNSIIERGSIPSNVDGMDVLKANAFHAKRCTAMNCTNQEFNRCRSALHMNFEVNSDASIGK